VFVDFVKSATFYLEIIVKDTNKGSSLDYLAQSLNLTKNAVMAIGDNYNDLSMIEYAECGVVMGQADDFIKSKAQFISLSNDENGVAYAIQNVIQKQ
jgi:hydroxymethylpyrimidine pyrophosphatase-like HAD family hydrolase